MEQEEAGGCPTCGGEEEVVVVGVKYLGRARLIQQMIHQVWQYCPTQIRHILLISIDRILLPQFHHNTALWSVQRSNCDPRMCDTSYNLMFWLDSKIVFKSLVGRYTISNVHPHAEGI